jgi:threonine/homoserine/homoserine lactone efflux protein|tara:strand:+ start:4927 stop:5547 length:621 start_codon:yes stop_codon:yes gene_type:complete
MEFFTVALLHFFAVSSPGPDFILVTRQAIKLGRKAAIYTSLGIGIGILIHSLAAIMGLTLIISSNPYLFLCMKLAASLYLFYLGLMSIIQTSETGNEIESRDSSELNSFLIGFITNVLNPKAIIFFVTLFSIVLNNSTSAALLTIYGLYMSAATFLWFLLISYVFTNKNLIEKYFYVLPAFEKIIGILLIIIASQIFIYELPNLYD